MTTADDKPDIRAPGRPNLVPLSFGSGVSLSEGEVVPVALTVEAGSRVRVSLPVGAFTLREGRARFVATIDVVGLAAVVLGIRVGRLAVRAAHPLVDALAHRVRGKD